MPQLEFPISGPSPKAPSMSQPRAPGRPALRPLPNFIFMSRWLQLPLYVGLILAQCVYVYHFWVELVHLIEAAFGSQTALMKLLRRWIELMPMIAVPSLTLSTDAFTWLSHSGSSG